MVDSPGSDAASDSVANGGVTDGGAAVNGTGATGAADHRAADTTTADRSAADPGAADPGAADPGAADPGGVGLGVSGGIVAAKRACRKELEARRRQLSEAERAGAATELAERVLGLAEMAQARTVAAYVGVGSEPDTVPLLTGLRARGVTLLLPITNPDMTLDWAEYTGDAGLATARYGLREPTGTRLGMAAVLDADVVLVPALAVDVHGLRLGRGGGCYDRVLTMLPPTTTTCALVYPHEVHPEVPAEPHDARVTMACTPDEVFRFQQP